MGRPRKVHEGTTALIECIIRVPGHPNHSVTFELTKFAGRTLARNRNPEYVQDFLKRDLEARFSEGKVKVIDDVPRSSKPSSPGGSDPDG